MEEFIVQARLTPDGSLWSDVSQKFHPWAAPGKGLCGLDPISNDLTLYSQSTHLHSTQWGFPSTVPLATKLNSQHLGISWGVRPGTGVE